MILMRARFLTFSVIVWIALSCGFLLATDLRVTDSSNAAVLVYDALVDYGTFSNDAEKDGIRILQGDAIVTAKWMNVQSLIVIATNTAVNPISMKVEIVMKNGQKISGALLFKGKMKLVGRTDLGDYSIDIAKIKSIVPAVTAGKN